MNDTTCTGPPCTKDSGTRLAEFRDFLVTLALNQGPPLQLKEDEATWQTFLGLLEKLDPRWRELQAKQIAIRGVTAWEHLLTRACAANREDFNSLIRIKYDQLLRAAALYLPVSEADVAVQEGSLKAWTKANTIAAPVTLPNFLRKCVIHKAKDGLKALSRRGAKEVPLVRPDDLPPPPLNRADSRPAYAGLLQKEDSAKLKRAISALPDKLREMVEMHYFNGLGPTEIAGVVGCKPDMVRYHLRQALSRMKSELKH
jgi:RNA polymerase sigma-70 factor (ECF subfamily)